MTRGRIAPFASFLRDLRRFLRDEYSIERASAIVRRELDRREENFLELVEGTVYGSPRSPYLALLRHAHCEFGDLARGVRADGLDTTLRALRAAGVYVSFEEFKGRAPIVRDGIEFTAEPSDFDNPLVAAGYRVRTSGSTGAATPVWISLRSLADRIPHTMLAFEAHGLLGAPCAMWREAPPAPAIGMILEEAPMGQRYEHWFAPPLRRSARSTITSRFVTDAIASVGRSAGVRLPRPEPLAYEHAGIVARWAARHPVCVVRTGLSNAVRVARTAVEDGIDLGGTAFVGAGEPVTPTKVEAIQRSGGTWLSNYTVSEAGRLGVPCARTTDPTDVHLAEHVTAVITHPRTVPGTDRTVETFHFSSLLPGTPKILLNTETDDYGTIETRSCGCPLEAAGLTRHMRDIFSFQKLTGEGVSLVGTDMLRILEEVLPKRFGGSSVDYQLVEEEDEDGLTRLTLVVSPRVELESEERVIDALLAGLGDSGLGRDVRSIWGRSGALRVRRDEPSMAQGGKVRPLLPRTR